MLIQYGNVNGTNAYDYFFRDSVANFVASCAHHML